MLSFEQIEEIIDAALPRIMVGDAAQSAGKDTAARGLPRRRLHRHPARGWMERAVQADEVSWLRSIMLVAAAKPEPTA